MTRATWPKPATGQQNQFSLCPNSGQIHQEIFKITARPPTTAEMAFLAFQIRLVVRTLPSTALTHNRQGTGKDDSVTQNQCSENGALAHQGLGSNTGSVPCSIPHSWFPGRETDWEHPPPGQSKASSCGGQRPNPI